MNVITNYFCFFVALFSCVSYAESNRHFKRIVNNRPVIGILSQELSITLEQLYGSHTSYIAASYVKFLESAGARVVPIWIGKDRDYYQNVLESINGVLFPGGAVYFNNTNGYGDAGRIILDIADEFNDHGDYFPVWGTCLGFEFLSYAGNSYQDLLINCSSSNQALPLEFKMMAVSSKLFGECPDEVISILESRNVTINFHEFCLTEDAMAKTELEENWTILSTNEDKAGLTFVSSMEHKTKPYFGVQFHPEKPAYEWKASHATPHDADAIRANYYFADFAVRQARLNGHSFSSEDEERQHLIYNYPTTMGKPTSSFSQLYFFDY